MAKKIAPLLPSTEVLLRQLGARLRVARLRRRITAQQLSERAGMAPMTLRSLERGGSGVTMGAYLAVMQVLGVEHDLNLLAAADPVGRELQDARLPAPHANSGSRRKTVPLRPGTAAASLEMADRTPLNKLRKISESSPTAQVRKAALTTADRLRKASASRSQRLRDATEALKLPAGPADLRRKGGFASAAELVQLLDVPALPKRRR